MATVRMRKGSKYADIFDSPEMIAGARADGYELVTEEKKAEKVETPEPSKADEQPSKKTPSRTKRQ